MDYSILVAELQHAQYASLTDAEIVAALNALPAPTRRRVPLCRSGQWCWLTVRSVDDDV